VNPILAYGLPRFVADAAAAGADGLIVPDLPPEEAGELAAACAAAGLALVHLAAPTTTAARLERLAAATTGFLYLVSVAGVTGARDRLPPDLADFIARARRVARTPLAVGFGISTPEQVAAVGRLADGVIIGSALIAAVARAADRPAAAQAFIAALNQHTPLSLSAAAERERGWEMG
ncbi:MAG: tryptophan synthase subunit alpha, partial [Anaerolineae bacterium]|nr:tryptophan synthase subunit alpha [Anaerolineae bacterium]